MHEGYVFGPDHELWTYLEEGDIIKVRAQARFGWQSIIKDAWVRIWERFDPIDLG